MPFTVVQTLENGKRVLSCVPEGWVKNNYLAWPRKKADKLSKTEDSLPGPDWFLMPCIVKRVGLTYSEGELAISIMTALTDTEDDETPTKIKKEGNSSIVKSYDDLVERCLDKEVVESIIEQPAELEMPLVADVNENEISNQLQYVLVVAQENETPSVTNAEKLDNIIVYLNVTGKNVNELQETQRQLMLRMISMQTQFEEFLRKSQQENLQKEIGFSLINSLESLQKLEDTLKEDKTFTELVTKFSLVCGSGKGKGLNNCFSVVDVIFDCNFLTTCSWAGGSRNEDKTKICFKSFGHVFRLFFSVIVKSDKNFTLKECEGFFKNVLRNSNRRSKAKLVRTSSTKIRAKRNKRGSETLNLNENSPPEPGPSRKHAQVPEQDPNRNAAAPEPDPTQNSAASEPDTKQITAANKPNKDD